MNTIQKYYLNRHLREFIRKKIDKKIDERTLKDTSSICFFITGDDLNRVEELLTCISSFYKEENVSIICYFTDKKEFKMEKFPAFLYVVSEKDVSLTGRVSECLQKIIEKKYDIFIDLDTKTNLLALYLKTLPKANFRVGSNQQNYVYFDFTLCADEQHSIRDYLSILDIYMSKIKRS